MSTPIPFAFEAESHLTSTSSPSRAHPPGVGVSMACDHFMLMHVEQLARSLTTLSSAVQGIETRQIAVDERLVELVGTVQGLQEENSSLAQRQDMVADMVHKKQEQEFNEAIQPTSGSLGNRLCESRLDEHERRLTKLSVDVTLLASRVAGTRAVMDGDGGPRSKESNALCDRLLELEKGQKKVVAAAQKALKMSMGLQHSQRKQLQQQDDLDKLLNDSLPDNSSNGDSSILALRIEEQDKAVNDLRHSCESLRDELQQAVMSNLTSQHLSTSGHDHRSDTSSQVDGQSSDVGNHTLSADGLVAMMQTVQARVDRNLSDMSRRLDSVQACREQHRLQNLQLGRQVPDLAQKVDQLWSQCRLYFSKVKEHDVHIDVMCNGSKASKYSKSLAFESEDPLEAAPQRSRPSEDIGYLSPSAGRLQAAAAAPAGIFSDVARAAGATVSPIEDAGSNTRLRGLPFNGKWPSSPSNLFTPDQPAPRPPEAASPTGSISRSAAPSLSGSVNSPMRGVTPVEAPTPTSLSIASGFRLLDEDDNDGGLELFGSASVFNERYSAFKVRKEAVGGDFHGA